LKSRYLITGVAGFIGSHVGEELIRRGDEVVGIDNFYSGRRENIEFLQSISNNNFHFLEIDFRDFEKLEKEVFQKYNIDGIFHIGAVASVQKSIEDPRFTNSVNVAGTLNILELARKYKIRRVVFSSSAAIYGDEPTLPKNENSIIAPISPYGYEKLIGEHYMDIYNSLYGVETVSLRYFNVYGERQDPSSEYSGVISIFEDRISKGIAPNIYGDGNQYRDFVYVKDVVKINILAMEKEGIAGEKFVVGTGKTTTINRLFEVVSKKHGKNLSPNYLPPREGDIRESVCDSSKVKKVFGFSQWIEFEEGISRL